MRRPTVDRRVVVLGGGWFIGRSIVEALLRKGYEVITVNRGVSAVRYSAPVERVVADRLRPARFTKVLKGIEASYLVDVTAYRARDTFSVLNAFRDRLVRAVHISTLSVYRWPFPCPIPENWPLVSNSAHSYGSLKAGCERVLSAEPADRFPWCILRLPAVYGPGDPISREHFFVRRILTHRPILLPDGRPFLCQNVFVDDVAEAACRLLESPQAVGRAYNIGAPSFTLEAYVRLAGRLLQRPVEIVQVGMDHLRAGGIDVNKIPYFFYGNLVLNTTRIAQEVGFEPSVTLEGGLSRTFAWLETSPVVDNRSWEIPFEREDRVLGTVAQERRLCESL